MKKKALKYLLPLGLCALILFSIFHTGFLSGISLTPKPQKKFHMVEVVIRLIRNDYVEEPNPSKTMAGAFRGLANSLDPLSCYLTPSLAVKYRERMETPLKETGLILYKKPGAFPQVVGIKENSPAQHKDVQIGDFISSIDHYSTLNMGMMEVNLFLKGEQEDPMDLKILRRGQTHQITLERKPLPSQPFSFFPTPGTSGILKIHHLYPSCVEKIEDGVLAQLKEKKKPLILDLRNCDQGCFTEVQELINLFVQSDHIGHLSKRGGKKERLSSPQIPPLRKMPLMVWINQGTLGPAEAAAAVLKDKKRAQLVGFPSLGLAARTELFSLEDGSGLLLVSSLFHLPSGKNIWKKGVQPHIKIEGKDQSTEVFLQKTLSSMSQT